MSSLSSFSTRGHLQAYFSNCKMSHWVYSRCLQLDIRLTIDSPWGHDVLFLNTIQFMCARPAEALSRLLSAGWTGEGMFPIPLLLRNTVTHIACPTLLPLITVWYDNVLHELHASTSHSEQSRCVLTEILTVSLSLYGQTPVTSRDKLQTRMHISAVSTHSSVSLSLPQRPHYATPHEWLHTPKKPRHQPQPHPVPNVCLI